MKWVKLFGTVLGIAALAAIPAQATTFSLTLDELLDIYVVSVDGTVVTSVAPFGPNVGEPGTDGDVDYASVWHIAEDGVGSARFGFDNIPITANTGGFQDLSAYDTFALILSNEIDEDLEILEYRLWMQVNGQSGLEEEVSAWTEIESGGASADDAPFALSLAGFSDLTDVEALGFEIRTTFSNTGSGDPRILGYHQDGVTINFNAEPIPEPASLALLGIGLVGMAIRRSRSRS